VSLGSSPFFLYAAVSTDASSAITADVDRLSPCGPPQRAGAVSSLPVSVKPPLAPSRSSQAIALVQTTCGIMASDLPDSLVNPYEDPAPPIRPRSSSTSRWFDSGLIDAKKDFESIHGRRKPSDTLPVLIYWKDDDSTNGSPWGINTDFKERRWGCRLPVPIQAAET
jgi:hypothetical protein